MNKKLIATCVIVFILAITSVASILYLFYERIYDRTNDLYNERAELSANLSSKIIETKLYTYLNVVSTTAETMKGQENVLTPRNLEKIKYVTKNQPDFLRMGISNDKGVVWYSDDKTLNIENTKSFKATSSGKVFITDRFTSPLSVGDVFMINVPIIGHDNKFHGHVQATISVKTFQNGTCNITDFNVFKTSIIDSNLNYILHMDHESILTAPSYKDRLNSFSNENQTNEIIKRMGKRESFAQCFKNENGDITTVYYTPLKINDWYLLTHLNSSAVDAHIATVLDKDIYYLVTIILLIVVCLGAALAFYYYKANQIIYTQELNFRNQLLSHTSAYLEVNMKSNKIVRASEAVNTRIKGIGDDYTLLFDYYLNKSIDDAYKPFVCERLTLPSLLKSYESGIEKISLEFIILVAGGKKSWREVDISFREEEVDDELMINAYMVIRNIDAQKSKELEFKEKAERDYLTGLYNRAKGTQLINEYLVQRKPDDCAALAIFDVDRFKSLNDTLGHNIGDMALKNVADIMTKHFRNYDVVCRLAGDEFIVLLKDLPSADVINKIIQPLLYKLNLSYGTGNNKVNITCSAGITIIDSNDKTFDDLYVKADKALYKAKREGRYSFKLYQLM